FPREYYFFRSVVKDIHLAELKDVESYLVTHAYNYQKKILERAGFMTNEKNTLFQHIGFIIAGYNNHFIAQIDEQVEWSIYKTMYMEGLNEHLGLVNNIDKY
nr:hypothetical protein [Vallitaleaceae bacterium]